MGQKFYGVLVQEVQIKQGRRYSYSFNSLQLNDGSRLDLAAFRQFANKFDGFKKGDYVLVYGDVEQYNNQDRLLVTGVYKRQPQVQEKQVEQPATQQPLNNKATRISKAAVQELLSLEEELMSDNDPLKEIIDLFKNNTGSFVVEDTSGSANDSKGVITNEVPDGYYESIDQQMPPEEESEQSEDYSIDPLPDEMQEELPSISKKKLF